MADTKRKPNNHRDTEPRPFNERTRRVMEFRNQIREGTYRPDPQAVARALLREWALASDLLEQPLAPTASPLEGFRAAATRFVVRPAGPDGHTPSAVARTA